MREDCSVLLIYVFTLSCIVIRHCHTSSYVMITIYSACIRFVVSPVPVPVCSVELVNQSIIFLARGLSTVAGACISQDSPREYNSTTKSYSML